MKTMIIPLVILLLIVNKISAHTCGCGNLGDSVEAIKRYADLWNSTDDNNKPLWGGDMQIHPKLLDYYYHPHKAKSRAAVDDNHRWTDNTIHFHIDRSFSWWQTSKIWNFIRDMKMKLSGCIKFVEHKIQPRYINYVHIHQSYSGCNAHVGMIGGRQSVNLGSSHCFHKSKVQHEMMHALGFHHEHQRPDRNNFLKVHGNNIRSSACNNFRICTNCRTFGIPYDYSSVMNYDTTTFDCVKGKPTMTSRTRGREIYPDSDGLTDWDVWKVEKYYQC